MPSNSVPYVINLADEKSAEVLIYDEIGESWFSEGVTAKQFAKDLKALGKLDEIHVRINSPGGSVFEGLGIYNALLRHKAKVTVHIDGIALSMASVIAMAGDEIEMAENALMMIHNPQGMVAGDAKAMRERADLLDRTKTSLLKAYVRHATVSDDELSEMMDAETWMTASEAESHGLVTRIGEPQEVAASWCADQLPYNVPDTWRARFHNKTSDEEPKGKAMPKEPTNTENAKTPATVEELTALKGSSPEFVVRQLTAKATLDDAILALNDELLASANAATTERDALKAKVAELEKAAAVKPQPSNGTKPSFGTQPLASDTNPNASNDGTPDPFNGSPAAFYKQEMAKRINGAGKTATQASSEIRAEYPGLMQAIVAAANPAA